MSNPRLPDAQTGLLVPTQIDKIADEAPSRTFGEFIDSPLTPGGVHRLDYGDLARAIDRLAWWMSSSIDLPRFSVVAYMGFPDVRYYIVLVAGIKCGYTILFPSISNHIDATTRLMDETICKAFLHTEDTHQDVQSQSHCPNYTVPDLTDLLNPTPVNRYPYPKTYPEAAFDPVFIMHTSGSTGFPKPQTWTNAHISVMAAGRTYPSFHGRRVSEYYFPEPGTRRFTGIVIYHASMVAGLSAAVLTGTTCVYPPLHIPTASYTPAQLETWLRVSRCETGVMLSSQLGLVEKSSSLLSQVGKLRKVFYIGAPISTRTAQLLTPHTQLATLWGSTETGYTISYETDGEDHNYICVDSECEGITWSEVSRGLYEMGYIRSRENGNRLKHPQYIFLTYPHLDSYWTGDLFSAHPDKEDHYKYEGRKDDHVVLSIGQNINPRALEERILGCEWVKGAVVVGSGRERVCLLLELEDKGNSERRFEDVWSVIQRASQGMREYERVQRGMVVLVSKEKPLPRTFKGNVRRGKAVELYKDEIERCYASFQSALLD